MSDYHQIIALEHRVSTLERQNGDACAAINRMADALDTLAELYQRLANRTLVPEPYTYTPITYPGAEGGD
jgi:hypothetical protein